MSQVNSQKGFVAINHLNKVFFPPFQCFCCGKEISKIQFRFSSLCSYCDVGTCAKINLGYEKGHGRSDICDNAEAFIG
jgi:hypothetical protein